MKFTTRFLHLGPIACSLLAVTIVSVQPTAAAAQGWGSITGQYVLDGDAPEPEVLVKQGDPQARDAKICAAHPVLSESLVVDSESKGIANIFVYLPRATQIHPDLEKSKEEEVVFDQKHCQFTPHALFARTDQRIVVKSDDGCAHNTHTFPLRNQAVNFLLSPNDRVGIKVEKPNREFLPFQVKCDIHPWMMAYWLVLDHPYAAVTDKVGKFKIKNLPAGEHEFRVWQEKVGYLERTLKVTVKDGETTDLGVVKIPVARFDD